MKFLCIILLQFLAITAYANDDYAAWAKKNTDGTWTLAAKNAVATSTLASIVPKDIKNFCPAYADKLKEEREIFWVGLLSIMARPESNFKPETTFTESFNDSKGKKVVSRGLLQISIESANQKKYDCQIAKPEDLHDPAINLACGVKILDAWVQTDGVIATYGANAERGGGRYWSTLRESNNHFPELTTFTKNLAVCQSAPFISIKDSDEDIQWVRKFYSEVIPKPKCDKEPNLTFPRWKGFPVEHCDYYDGGVHTKPYLLNPTADKLAHWTVNACRDIEAASIKKCIEHLNELMREASSYGYFPVAGYIPEPSDAVDGKIKGVMYCTLFRDGVTIATDNWDTSPAVKDKCGSDNENDVPVKKAKTYARIISTTREEYIAAGGKLPVDGLNWLDIVRQLYQSAWNTDRNQLIFAKALAEKKRGAF